VTRLQGGEQAGSNTPTYPKHNRRLRNRDLRTRGREEAEDMQRPIDSLKRTGQTVRRHTDSPATATPQERIRVAIIGTTFLSVKAA
jgi:hypothetical protein